MLSRVVLLLYACKSFRLVSTGTKKMLENMLNSDIIIRHNIMPYIYHIFIYESARGRAKGSPPLVCVPAIYHSLLQSARTFFLFFIFLLLGCAFAMNMCVCCVEILFWGVERGSVRTLSSIVRARARDALHNAIL